MDHFYEQATLVLDGMLSKDNWADVTHLAIAKGMDEVVRIVKNFLGNNWTAVTGAILSQFEETFVQDVICFPKSALQAKSRY